MKSTPRPSIVLLCLVVAACIATPVAAGPRSGPAGAPGQRGFGGPPPCWTKDLTEDQVARIEQSHRDFRDATRDLRRELRQRRLALAAELARKAPDADEAGKMQASISGMKTELAQKRLQHLLQIKRIAPDLDCARLRRFDDFDRGPGGDPEPPYGRGRGGRGGGFCRR